MHFILPRDGGALRLGRTPQGRLRNRKHSVKWPLALPSPSLNDLCCGIASTLRLEPEDCILCGLLVSASDCENQQGGKGDQETRRLRGGEPSCETSSAL